MAKAKRERRNSFRTMAADQALEALDRIEQMERQEQATSSGAEVVPVVPDADSETTNPAWNASAVLVGRHLERVANNGGELGGRVNFIVTGEPFQRMPVPD